MHKALLIDLFALPEYDISLALGYLKAYADADPRVAERWEHEGRLVLVDEIRSRVAGLVDEDIHGVSRAHSRVARRFQRVRRLLCAAPRAQAADSASSTSVAS